MAKHWSDKHSRWIHDRKPMAADVSRGTPAPSEDEPAKVTASGDAQAAPVLAKAQVKADGAAGGTAAARPSYRLAKPRA